MDEKACGRREIWTLRGAFLGGVAILPFLGAVVSADLARGRINTAAAVFAAVVALVLVFLLAVSYWARARGSRPSNRPTDRPRPALLLPFDLLFLSLAIANAVAMYHRGWFGLGVLASAAAGLWAASVVSVCVAKFASG